MTLGKLDLRSLAIFRMALGALLFSQAILLAPDYTAFYGNGGLGSGPGWIQTLVPIFLFGTIPLAAVALIVGFLSRWATALAFVSLIFVQLANPQILQGGDVLLRLLLFWSLFLPLGDIWSIDAWRSKRAVLSLPLTTQLASWALTLQVCFVYWFAALLKSDPLWTQSGNALFYALNIEHFTTPWGLYMRQFPDLLRIVTFSTLIIEWTGPLLLLIPFHRDACRLMAVALFISFHLICMQALLRIGLFPWACATAWLVFIPGIFWNRFIPLTSSPTNKQDKRRSKVLRHGPRSISDRACLLFVLVALMDVIAWNIASVQGSSAQHWMRQHDVFGNLLRLDQRWNMYAPYPRSEHGWLVVPADLANGQQVDLFTSQPVSWEKPQDIGASFGDDRWRRYLSNLFDDRDPKALQAYADYLVKNWNHQQGPSQQIQAVTIIFMKQITQSDLSVTPPTQEVLYFHAF